MDENRARSFVEEVHALRQWMRDRLTLNDYVHLRKMERWGRLCSFAGYATAWILPNPLSAALISHGIMTRWFVGHQINHGGYDEIPGIPERYRSRTFGMGWRRFFDWFDWMVPYAWELEHVTMHHIRTGEREDPDLVERNLGKVRKSKHSMLMRYIIVLVNISTWKWSYYAPQTLMFAQNQRNGERDFRAFWKLFDFRTERGREFWRICLLPYFIYRFILIPAAFLLISPRAALFTLFTTMMAELFTNWESFALIGPNHTGSDLYGFNDKAASKAEFYVRQVLTTANYPTGGDARDFAYGFLNYQIEHHIWPDMPLSKYQEVQSRFRELCAKYGLTYLQEGLRVRILKTFDVMVGKASMQRATSKDIQKKFGLEASSKLVATEQESAPMPP